jgi:hypothetical protein
MGADLHTFHTLNGTIWSIVRHMFSLLYRNFACCIARFVHFLRRWLRAYQNRKVYGS